MAGAANPGRGGRVIITEIAAFDSAGTFEPAD
jgi:hypothetical protein